MIAPFSESVSSFRCFHLNGTPRGNKENNPVQQTRYIYKNPGTDHGHSFPHFSFRASSTLEWILQASLSPAFPSSIAMSRDGGGGEGKASDGLSSLGVSGSSSSARPSSPQRLHPRNSLQVISCSQFSDWGLRGEIISNFR